MTERKLFDREMKRIATFCKNPPPRGARSDSRTSAAQSQRGFGMGEKYDKVEAGFRCGVVKLVSAEFLSTEGDGG